MEAAIKKAKLYHDAMANAPVTVGGRKPPYVPRLQSSTSASSQETRSARAGTNGRSSVVHLQ